MSLLKFSLKAFQIPHPSRIFHGTPQYLFLVLLFLILPLSSGFGNLKAQDSTRITWAELEEAEQEAERAQDAYQQEVDQIQSECFRIMGEIKDWIGNYLVIWGVAVPQDNDFSKESTVINKGNIEVFKADPEAIYAGTYE